MDPDVALKGLRERADSVLNGDAESVSIEAFAELFQALDQWMTRGGYLPDSWAEPVRRRADSMR